MNNINNRINWIDWAKTIGIMIVVFCHIPQYNTLEKEFMSSFQMPLFFFLSGYLHKMPKGWKTSLHKYLKTLIIPYILFQPIFYPYWLVQKTQQEGLHISNLTDSVIKPFTNCFIGTPIDGITWFVFALFIMKILADIILRSKNSVLLTIIACTISIYISYKFHQDNVINITFAIDSLFDLFPFFMLGYYMKSNKYCDINNQKRVIYIVVSIILMAFSITIIKNQPDLYWLQRLDFYILGITGTFFIIYLCKCIKSNSNIVITISKGTIILLGLHWMFIGTTNFILEKFLHLNSGILYTTLSAIFIVFAITIANYYIILFCQRHFRIILGGR